MKRASAPIPFAGSLLDETRHVCAFFNSDDEEYRVSLPFIRDGFQCGHKAIHVVNPDQRRSQLQRLNEAGIDPTSAQQSGQLELRVNTDVYLPDGCCDPGRMIAVFERPASGNTAAGFPLSRLCCRMDWAVEDRSRVGGDAVIDIMRTHPGVIIGGILQRNPFYIPPEQFLGEFRQRRARRSTSPAAA